MWAKLAQYLHPLASFSSQRFRGPQQFRFLEAILNTEASKHSSGGGSTWPARPSLFVNTLQCWEWERQGEGLSCPVMATGGKAAIFPAWTYAKWEQRDENISERLRHQSLTEVGPCMCFLLGAFENPIVESWQWWDEFTMRHTSQMSDFLVTSLW